LDYIAAQGISPDSEPTARDLAVLIDQINKDNIKYVFYEELASPRIAEMLSKETNTDLLLLNAAHNISKEQLEKGISFITIMKNNLNNLKIGLEYKQ
jgi:zinc transport system substrate-binding protein